jgi:hypothetical protein
MLLYAPAWLRPTARNVLTKAAPEARDGRDLVSIQTVAVRLDRLGLGLTLLTLLIQSVDRSIFSTRNSIPTAR